jgi:GntR family transcriptional regulator/MocR family aminotransferase
VLSGSQQALDLIARLLLDPGDQVWLEDPGYVGARGVWIAAGARLVPVPVDGEGLRVDWGIRRAPRARLAYVTPSHQFPTGVTMTLPRRLALLEWARRRRGAVIEDDYDSDFHYDGRPLAALYGLSDSERVVYVGTFSKTLFPALRLGFVVLPPLLVETFSAVRQLADGFPPTLVQAAAARLLESGLYDRHVRRQLASYRERRDALLLGARRHLAGLAEVGPVEAGLHAVAWLVPEIDDRAAAEAAAQAGLDTIALSACALRPPGRGGLVLGFAAFPPAQIDLGLRRLGAVLSRLGEAAGRRR